MNVLKSLAKKALYKAGLEVRRVSKTSTPEDLRGELSPEESALKGRFLSQKKAYVVEVSVKKIRATRAQRARVEALEVYQKNKKRTGSLKTVLRSYYSSSQYSSAGDVLGLKKKREWHTREPMCFILPWAHRTPSEALKRRQKMMKTEAKSVGFSYEHSDGWKGFGPVSERIVSMESKRLSYIYESILENGYIEDYGYIGGQLFMDNGTYYVTPKDGWHRTAVLKVLGYDTIPMRFKKSWLPVRRSEVKLWPNVQNGWFSVKEALTVLDHIYPFKL